MIHIADLASFGTQHEQFNKSFIELALAAHPADGVTVFGHSDLLTAVGEIVPASNRQEIPIYHKRGGVKEFIRAYHQFKTLKKLIQAAKKKQVDALYILRIHPFAQYLFKTLIVTELDVYIVLHGELESIKFNKHFVNKIWGWFLQKAMSLKRAHVHYIILGQSIYQNLLAVLPAFKSQKTVILDHPYPFNRQRRIPDETGKIRFSSIGVATTAKNSHFFFQGAEKVNLAGLGERCHFTVCGQVYENMQPYFNPYVEFRQNRIPFTREELNQLFKLSHFAVFYYENSHYSLCPSGAFWDAVDSELPLLYVKNDYFDYYSSVVGDIGLSFDGPEQLNTYIMEVAKAGKLPDNYFLFVSNIQKLKFEYMSKSNLLSQLNYITHSET